jgi:hypothetical protein
MPYALYTSRRYCGVAFIFLRNTQIKRTGNNGTVNMFDFVELIYSGISSCTSIESSVIVKCAKYNFSKKGVPKRCEPEPNIRFKTALKIISAPFSV